MRWAADRRLVSFGVCIRSLLLLSAIFLTSCSTQQRVADTVIALPQGVLFELLAPSVVGRSVQATQKIQGSYRENRFVMLAYLDIDGDAMSLVATTVSGATIFSLSFKNGVVDVVRSPLAPKNINAKHVLADLQLIFWPHEALEVELNELNGDSVQLSYGASMLSRSLLNNGETVIAIEYDDENLWRSVVNYRNLIWGYRYRIETIELTFG